ncbi:leucine-rich repeat-containing protein 2 isoform X2 [Corythoichthys intestinalis]|uniref:leucine-rich repeat-containing protein 2 isoform X2 n=1 Tax=Corythoichthys intestinalis TaxID=161448 RepID=UPI0025A5CAA2|nr:leucine-rich repeat-containing protein 2 isoform X2 [Corythoichthys intestinalis]
MKCGTSGFCDVSSLLGVWESRVKKHRQRQKKEQERKERSALARIEQQWHYRLYCKTLTTQQRNLLNSYLQNTHSAELKVTGEGQRVEVLARRDEDADEDALLFRLSGEQWKDFPKDLEWKTFLLEWHVSDTKIQKLPDYLASFSLLRVLDLPKNELCELPPGIGQLGELRQLNVSYNRLSRVPAELGMCENLERLELCGNRHLSELPFELSSLKRLVHLDIAENGFLSIPVCTLRMSALQLLDLSDNRLGDLPQDMDRLCELVTLFLHKNRLSYLPHCLTNIATLRMIVVSGAELVCIPTQLCSNPRIKFIRLYDRPTSDKKKKKRNWRTRRQEVEEDSSGEEEEQMKDSREKEFMDAYVSMLKDRDDVPYSTTKVTISCML